MGPMATTGKTQQLFDYDYYENISIRSPVKLELGESKNYEHHEYEYHG